MDGTNDEFSSTKSNLDVATAVQGSNTISSTTSDPSEGKIINKLYLVLYFTSSFLTGSGKYQPQVSHLISSGEEEGGAKVATMKPVKQTVTYDSSTGKMYEELGSSGSSGESCGHHPVIM